MEGKDLGFLYFPFIYRPSPVAPHHADSTQQMDISQALMGLLSSQPSQFFLTGADEHKHQDAIRMAPNYCIPEQLPLSSKVRVVQTLHPVAMALS